MKAKFKLLISYSQIVVFDPDLPNPFNDWKPEHVQQGFTWRPGSVSFGTLPDQNYTLDISVNQATRIKLAPGTVRAIQIPFTVSQKGIVAFASVGTEVNVVKMPPGEYTLVFETAADWCRFTFLEQISPAKILVKDELLTPKPKLLMEADPA